MVDDLCQVLRYDRRGSGRSQAVGPYDVATFVRDLERLREHFCFAQWIVGGHSWGAGLALAYAVQHPHRTQALRREMREELGAEIADLELRAVTEEIFEVVGQIHHGIVFLYEGRFVDPSYYARPVIPYVEGSVPRAKATWMPVSVFVSGRKRLVPVRLVEILTRRHQ